MDEQRKKPGWAFLTTVVLFGLPFLVFGLGFRKLIGLHKAVRRNSQWVTRIGGAMLIVLGILLVTGTWGQLTNLLQGWIDGFWVAVALARSVAACRFVALFQYSVA